MAVLTMRRRQPRDPDGRMPLRQHFAELRSRVLKAGAAILIGTVVGWYQYQFLFKALQSPMEVARREHGVNIALNFTDILSPFNLQLKLSVYTGIVLASPVWLYQLWAFIIPGLTRREKRYSFAFVAAAVPLFAAGLGLAWLALPNAVSFFADFVPEDATAFTSTDQYFSFVTRLMLSFGIAFVLPLILVALNLAGLMSALAMAKAWRIVVFITFIFAAVASPTPDVSMMFLLALPMIVLYLIAVGIAWLVDKRRARRSLFRDVADDEATEIDDPDAVEPAGQEDDVADLGVRDQT